MKNLTFSIIIPTYNEAEDIEKSLHKILSQKYPHKEIIVVDSASTDGTTEILENYAKLQKIHLIKEKARNGVSAARNLGAKNAQGDVLLFLNADVVLDQDFLDKVVVHYQKGADFVVCNSQVINLDSPVSAYIQAIHNLDYDKKDDLVWSEGWTCRREAFEKIGGFRKFPKGSAGEDAAVGFDLENAGYQRVYDKKIFARHIAPEGLQEFKRLRSERGKGGFYFALLYQKINPYVIAGKFLGKLLVPVAVILIAPLFLNLPWFVGPLALVIGIFVFFSYRGIQLSQALDGKFLLPFIPLNFLEWTLVRWGFLKAMFKYLMKPTKV